MEVYPKLSESELDKLEQRYEYAFSYVIPLWRVLFFSFESNYIYWRTQVNKRLCES